MGLFAGCRLALYLEDFEGVALGLGLGIKTATAPVALSVAGAGSPFPTPHRILVWFSTTCLLPVPALPCMPSALHHSLMASATRLSHTSLQCFHTVLAISCPLTARMPFIHT